MSDKATTMINELMMAFDLDFYDASLVHTVTIFQWDTRAEMAHDIIHNFDERWPATFQWLRQCHHYPSIVSMKMHIIDEILDTHGVEGFALDGYFSNPFLDGTHFEYCNTGDTYDMTVGYCPIEKEFIITSWGDYYEWAEVKGHVIREGEL